MVAVVVVGGCCGLCSAAVGPNAVGTRYCGIMLRISIFDGVLHVRELVMGGFPPPVRQLFAHALPALDSALSPVSAGCARPNSRPRPCSAVNPRCRQRRLLPFSTVLPRLTR
eukprot:365203-Chlamydomonas_euryale.AAC.20